MSAKRTVFLIQTIICISLLTLITSVSQAIDYGEILSAETKTGSIAQPAQTDSYTFNGYADQAVMIIMSRSGGSYYFDTQIDLYDPNGNLEKSASCGRCSTVIGDYKLLRSGTYTIIARESGADSTDSYSLSLLLISGPTTSPSDLNGGDILSGETKVGTINLGADTDAYTFNGEIDETISVIMSRSGGSYYFDTQIDLYDPNGNLEKSASCGRCSTVIGDYKLLQSGTYTIIAREAGADSTDSYSLSLTKIPETQYTPSARLSLNQDTFITGDTLIITAHTVNGPNPFKVEVKSWYTLPVGGDVSILKPHTESTIRANSDVKKDLGSYTFKGTEPAGIYTIGYKLINIVTGREYSVDFKTFTYTP